MVQWPMPESPDHRLQNALPLLTHLLPRETVFCPLAGIKAPQRESSGLKFSSLEHFPPSQKGLT